MLGFHPTDEHRRRAEELKASAIVSAGLKGSQFGRFRGELLGLPVVREHTYALAATQERQQSRFAN